MKRMLQERKSPTDKMSAVDRRKHMAHMRKLYGLHTAGYGTPSTTGQETGGSGNVGMQDFITGARDHGFFPEESEIGDGSNMRFELNGKDDGAQDMLADLHLSNNTTTEGGGVLGGDNVGHSDHVSREEGIGSTFDNVHHQPFEMQHLDKSDVVGDQTADAGIHDMSTTAIYGGMDLLQDIFEKSLKFKAVSVK